MYYVYIHLPIAIYVATISGLLENVKPVFPKLYGNLRVSKAVVPYTPKLVAILGTTLNAIEKECTCIVFSETLFIYDPKHIIKPLLIIKK